MDMKNLRTVSMGVLGGGFMLTTLLEGEAIAGLVNWLLMTILLVVFVVLAFFTWDATTNLGTGVKWFSVVGALITVAMFVILALYVPVVTPENKPTYDLTISETTCYDFADWATDGDCATGTSEMSLNDATKKITVNVELNGTGDTSVPDSLGIKFLFRRTDEGWREEGVTVATAVTGAVTPNIDDWKLENTTEAGKFYYIVNYNTDGVRAIGWTDFSDNTIVGEKNSGTMGTLAPGGSDHAIFTLYFSETALPDWENNQGVVTKTWDMTFTFTSEGYTIATVDLTLSLKWLETYS